jgi:type III secretory pathway component EscS
VQDSERAALNLGTENLARKTASAQVIQHAGPSTSERSTMLDRVLKSIPPVVRTALLGFAIASLALALGQVVDTWLAGNGFRVPLIMVIGWLGCEAAWMIPLILRIREAMEEQDGP